MDVTVLWKKYGSSLIGLLLGTTVTSAFATETVVANANTTLKGTISIGSSCLINPVTVKFDEIMDSISSDKKAYKSQPITFECNNIPAEAMVRLSNDLASSSGGNWYENGYLYTTKAVEINGQNFPIYYGIKPSGSVDTSIQYQAFYHVPDEGDTYSVPTEFMVYLPAIEQMMAATTASGSLSHSIEVTIPLEVSLIKE